MILLTSITAAVLSASHPHRQRPPSPPASDGMTTPSVLWRQLVERCNSLRNPRVKRCNAHSRLLHIVTKAKLEYTDYYHPLCSYRCRMGSRTRISYFH